MVFQHLVAQAAEAIANAMHFSGKIVLDTTKSDGQYKKTASNEKLMTLNPGFEFTPFRQAIEESVEWFVTHYEEARK